MLSPGSPRVTVGHKRSVDCYATLREMMVLGKPENKKDGYRRSPRRNAEAAVLSSCALNENFSGSHFTRDEHDASVCHDVFGVLSHSGRKYTKKMLNGKVRL